MSLEPYPISHPIGAAEKQRQLTRIRTRVGLRFEFTNNTTEADVMRKGKKVATIMKESMRGRQVWAAYSLGGKRMGFADIHKLKDLLKQIAKSV
jgi:hypothetical protein